MDDYISSQYEVTNSNRGRGQAIGALVCGIFSLANCWLSFFLFTVVIPLASSIVSLSLAKTSESLGFTGKMARVGRLFAVLGLIFCILFFIIAICFLYD